MLQLKNQDFSQYRFSFDNMEQNIDDNALLYFHIISKGAIISILKCGSIYLNYKILIDIFHIFNEKSSFYEDKKN